MSGKAKETGLVPKNSLKTKRPRTPVHFNGHQLCVINATYYQKSNDIQAIAIFPFNIDFELIPEVVPFSCEIQSRSLTLDNGVHPDAFPDVLSDWFTSLSLPYGKKLNPIAWNVPRLTAALEELIDLDMEETFHEWRDLLQISLFLNDRAWDRGDRIPFPKREVGSALTRALDLEPCIKDAPLTAVQMIQLYKRFLKKR